MRPRKGTKFTDGERFPGAMKPDNIPGHVRERMRRMWDHAPEDRMVQRVDPRYFVVRNPIVNCWELWVSNPYPANSNGVQFVGAVQYPGEPQAPVDNRFIDHLKELHPETGMREPEYAKYCAEIHKIEEAKKEREKKEKQGVEDQNFQRDFTDPVEMGRILRPGPKVVVPTNLMGGIHAPGRTLLTK